MLNP
jgi:adenosine deaminase